MQSRGNANIKGIDISNHQGNVDFIKVKASGVEAVIMKASESDWYRDAYLDQNYAGAKAAGLKVGFYHFFDARKDAKQQASFFVNCIRGKVPDCRLVLDIETTQNFDKDTLSQKCVDFLEEVKRIIGKEVMVYTYTSFARENLNNSLSVYPLWIAEYSPAQPHDNPIWNEWVGFQYASDGHTDGVNTLCDVDIFTSEIFIEEKKFNIHMFAHVQNIGNMDDTEENDCTIGTTGQALRIEALEIDIDNGVDITIDTHIQDIGDVNGVTEGQIQGTMHQAKRLEAVQIKVNSIPEGYVLKYQAHVQNVGWQDWVNAGEWAGTKGQALRLEALRVKIERA